jgi:hypothetical protein
MSIKTKIVGKNSKELAIEDSGAINVYVVPRPPETLDMQPLPFSEYLKLDGTGTTSFLIDGSATNKDFYVSAKSYDVYVNTIVFEIADATSTLNKFGNLTALTNGLDFYYFGSKEGKYIIEDGLKTNYDLVKLANFEPPFGDSPLTNAIGASEAYVGVIDLEDVFGLQWGLKLRADSTDRIGFTVKDDITGIDAMTIKVYGIRV